jgi:Universal stress protein UspA and related nucleotide-binding proteins
MKTIIAPTDFSEASLNAVIYAADMARVLKTDLLLLHVVGIPNTFNELSPPIYNISELLEDAESELKLLRNRMRVRTKDLIKISIKAIVGKVVSVIDELSDSLNTYAIVMGAESTGPFERILFGAKTISSIKRLSCPLIVVPNKVRFTGLKRIGLACDFKDVIETVPVKEIKNLLKGCPAELYVLHVSPVIGDGFNEETDEEAMWLQEIIGDFKPKYRFIEGTDVEKGIIEFAEKNKLDLLIVIPKRHNIINKLFHRSHSNQLVLQSHVPVMAIHEQN